MTKQMTAKIAALATSLAAIAAIVGSAHAQTSPAPAAPGGVIANILDGADPGTITVAGITVYGTFDVGFAYLSHAATRDSLGGNYIGQPYVLQSNSLGSRSTYQNNALSQSAVGIKGTQKLADLMGDAAKG